MAAQPMSEVASDAREACFALQGEDHTLGNALRYMLNKNPNVALAVLPSPQSL